MEFSHKKTSDSALSYGENPESLSLSGLDRYRIVTPGQTDRQTDRRTDGQNYDKRLTLRAVARRKEHGYGNERKRREDIKFGESSNGC